MEFENNSNTELQQQNIISSNEDNDSNNSSNNEEDESFLDRMQHEKRKHSQSIEILHRRRPTREQLMEAGIMKPAENFNMELDVVVEDILEDIKQNDIDTELKTVKLKDKKKKKKKKTTKKQKQKQKQKHVKDPSFAPAIINDDFGAAWDGENKGWQEYIEEKTNTKKKPKKSDEIHEQSDIKLVTSDSIDITEPVMANNNDNDENDMEQTINGPIPLQLTANNLQKHNKLFSINGEFVINKFLELKDENGKKENKNSIKKQQSKSKVVKNKNKNSNVKNNNVKVGVISKNESKKSVSKLTKTKTPKLPKKKSRKLKENRMINSSKVNKDLKQWMVKNSVWDNGLYTYLILNGILSMENIIGLNQNKFDRIVRQFRMEQFAKVRHKKSRNHIDKILIKFEKSWKKIKKKKKKKKK